MGFIYKVFMIFIFMAKNRRSKNNFKISVKKQVEFDVILKSLVGNYVKIVESKIENQVGFCGELVDETANFLILEYEGSTVKILKSNVTIEVEYKGKPLYIDGRFLLSTLTQRIKKYK